MGVFKRAFAFILTAAMLISAAGCSKTKRVFSISTVENILISRNAYKYNEITGFTRAVLSPSEVEGKPVYMSSEGMDAQSLYNVIVNHSMSFPAAEVTAALYSCFWQNDPSGTPSDTTVYVLHFSDEKTADKIYRAIDQKLVQGWANARYASGKDGYQYSTVIIDVSGGQSERGVYLSRNSVVFVRGFCDGKNDNALIATVCDKLGVVTPVDAK